MNIFIHHNLSVAEIQELFSSRYPYLKVEFFESGVLVAVGRRRTGVSPSTVLGDISSTGFEGDFEFTDDTTVSDFERILEEKFGLASQVYRRAGNIWIETNITDMWTLAHQNEQGRQLSTSNGIHSKEK